MEGDDDKGKKQGQSGLPPGYAQGSAALFLKSKLYASPQKTNTPVRTNLARPQSAPLKRVPSDSETGRKGDGSNKPTRPASAVPSKSTLPASSSSTTGPGTSAASASDEPGPASSASAASKTPTKKPAIQRRRSSNSLLESSPRSQPKLKVPISSKTPRNKVAFKAPVAPKSAEKAPVDLTALLSKPPAIKKTTVQDVAEIVNTINNYNPLQQKKEPASRVRGKVPENMFQYIKKNLSEEELRDPQTFIDWLKDSPSADFDFVYLKYRLHPDDKMSIVSMYDLDVVEFKECDPNDYFTLSSAGITHYVKGQPEFEGFTEWVEGRSKFFVTRKMSYFREYTKRKLFWRWKAIVKSKFGVIRENLEERLVVSLPDGYATIQRVRKKCLELQKTELFLVQRSFTYDLTNFTRVAMRRDGEAQDVETRDRPIGVQKDVDEFYRSVRKAVISNVRNTHLDNSGGDADVVATASHKQVSILRRLKDLVRLCDLMIFESAFELVTNSLHDLKTSILGRPKKVNEDGELVEEDETQAILYPGVGMYVYDGYKRSYPMFHVQLQMRNLAMLMSPSLQEFKTGLTTVIEDGVDTVNRIPRLVFDEELFHYLSYHLTPVQRRTYQSGNNIRETILDHWLYTDGCESVFRLVEEAYAACEASFGSYRELIEMADPQNHVDIKGYSFSDGELPRLDRYGDILSLLKHQIAETKKLTDKQQWGCLLLDRSVFMADILPIPSHALQQLQALIPLVARKLREVLQRAIDQQQPIISTVPETLEEAVEWIKFCDQLVESENAELQRRHQECTSLYELMDDEEIEYPSDDAAGQRKLTRSFWDLQTFIDNYVDSRRNMVGSWHNSLETRLEAARHREAEASNALADELVQTITDCVSSEVVEKLELLKKEVRSLKIEIGITDGFQKLFKESSHGCEDCDKLLADVEVMHTVWSLRLKWEEYIPKIKTTPLDALTSEAVREAIDAFTSTLNECTLMFTEGHPVIDDSLRELEEFKKLASVLYDMKNPCMQLRHWVSSYEAIYEETVPGQPAEEYFKGVTLQMLEEGGVMECRREIADISNQATQEHALVTSVVKITKTWRTFELTITTYKNEVDVYILGSVEKVKDLIDEQMITLAAMRASRFVQAVESSLEEWAANLTLMKTVLKLWLRVQQLWMFLEPIFSSPEIQRQLRSEADDFHRVDKSWRQRMKEASVRPNAMRNLCINKFVEQFTGMIKSFEILEAKLQRYLDEKRFAFPRFFFLSNNELVEILAESRNPRAVQPFLPKCFENIASLRFTKAGHVVAMTSAEEETVSFDKQIRTRDAVETWLSEVELRMRVTLRGQLQEAINDYHSMERELWIFSFSAMAVSVAIQVLFCRRVTSALSPHVEFATVGAEGDAPGSEVEESTPVVDKVTLQQVVRDVGEWITELVGLVRGNITSVQRSLIGILLIQAVHNRSVLEDMMLEKISSVESFGWLKRLRYYFDDSHHDGPMVRQANAELTYGHEFLGCSSRLVITPLTDRCYLTLTSALRLCLGGAPTGPAGTGKTETVKDLAKSLGRHCVVFNCSEGLDYKMMGQFFSGLVQTGAWACFDEFNRIDVEVLSVVAQQLLTIQLAISSRQHEFVFEGKEMSLNPSCGIFITMNPGYAGRSELPDNVKALFRPVAMMAADLKLIAEIILLSCGFEDSRVLAVKVSHLYNLCPEQLSRQSHYDFGLRSLKSVLTLAATLRRKMKKASEEEVLFCAIRDSNLPKLLANDAENFKSLLRDLFPQQMFRAMTDPELEEKVSDCIYQQNLQPLRGQIEKVVQLQQTMKSRHGVMVVGGAAVGKSTVVALLAETMQHVETHLINPKALSVNQLFGSFDELTHEWTDGLIGTIVRDAIGNKMGKSHWLMFDGPVDSVWVENLNTVLDDNRMLFFANGERIKLPHTVHMMFEVDGLTQASPATVSRCGMVYLHQDSVGWNALTESRLKVWDPGYYCETILRGLFDHWIPPGLNYLNTCKKIKEDCPSLDSTRIMSLLSLIESLLVTGDINVSLNASQPGADLMKSQLEGVFVFAYVWGMGGNLARESRAEFDEWVRTELGTELSMPVTGSVYDFYFEAVENQFVPFDSRVDLASARVSDAIESRNLRDLFIPTGQSESVAFLLSLAISSNQPTLLIGPTGSSKTSIMNYTLQNSINSGFQEGQTFPVHLRLTATSTPETIEWMLREHMTRAGVGAPFKAKHEGPILFFLDDLNMPRPDAFGFHPSLEVVRQLLDYGGFYTADNLQWGQMSNILLVGAVVPAGSGGGRSYVSPRLQRHFLPIYVPEPTESTLRELFEVVMRPFFDQSEPVATSLEGVVSAVVRVYLAVKDDMKATPANPHYMYNLRDLVDIFNGIVQCDVTTLLSNNELIRLCVHELRRVLGDRMSSLDDKDRFEQMMFTNFNRSVKVPGNMTPLSGCQFVFGDFGRLEGIATQRPYSEIWASYQLKPDVEPTVKGVNLRHLLSRYQDVYLGEALTASRLVFFHEAIEHVARLTRVFRQQRGHMLCLGLAGMGKQSLVKFATWLCGYHLFTIQSDGGSYTLSDWREDLKSLYFLAGVEAQHVVFLVRDTDIIDERMLDDVNSLLSSCSVPQLWNAEERERAVETLKQLPEFMSTDEGNELQRMPKNQLLQIIHDRAASRLHVSLALSPIGKFRSRINLYPALVDFTTIDYYWEWPLPALRDVGVYHCDPIKSELGEDGLPRVVKLGVYCYQSSLEATELALSKFGRGCYVTPFDLIDFFHTMTSFFRKRKTELNDVRQKMSSGLLKLKDVSEQVKEMEKELQLLQPELAEAKKDAESMLAQLSVDREEAETLKSEVEAKEADVAKETRAVKVIVDEAEADLQSALPALDAATKALNSLNKGDITEVRTFAHPPHLVEVVMEAVCIVKGVSKDWASAKHLLGMSDFLKQLIELDKNTIKESTMKQLSKYVEMEEFVPDNIAKVSLACKSLCEWVRAVYHYKRTYDMIVPKRERAAEANKALEAMVAKLKEAQERLSDVARQLSELQSKYDAAVRKKDHLNLRIEDAEIRIERAKKLTSGLKDEQIRWKQVLEGVDDEEAFVVGDCTFAAAVCCFLGPFPSEIRNVLKDKWAKRSEDTFIVQSEKRFLEKLMLDPVMIREWCARGLPDNQVSIESCAIARTGTRYPLMIDPQSQANHWIKTVEPNLQVVGVTEQGLNQILENAIMYGLCILVENVLEELPPNLFGILKKDVFEKDGQVYIRVGSRELQLNEDFRLYMTSRLPNPHYPPDVFIQTSVINFSVTELGLEDQLLGVVVKIEEPTLEEKKDALIVETAGDRRTLRDLEDEILRMVNESKGNLLDDESLISVLNDSNTTSTLLKGRLADAVQTEEQINAAREVYRAFAKHGSRVFFILSDLESLSSLYRYSLPYYLDIYKHAITNKDNNGLPEETESDERTRRVHQLMQKLNKGLFTNVSRGLFESHKHTFLMHLCFQIQIHEGSLSMGEWNHFLLEQVKSGAKAPAPSNSRVPTSTQSGGVESEPAKDELAWLTPAIQSEVEWLEKDRALDHAYDGLLAHMRAHPSEWEAFVTAPVIEDGELPEEWEHIRPFQKLQLVKILRPESLPMFLRNYPALFFGEAFRDPPVFDLKWTYEASSPRRPVIFVLTPGFDAASIMREMAVANGDIKVDMCSLGQGQGPIAEELITKARQHGNWVLLQNCHLAKSWMPSLEAILDDLVITRNLNEDFRLWLTTAESKDIPVTVIQSGVKVTNEPPKGVRSNLVRTWDLMDEDLFSGSTKPSEFKVILYALSLFHAIVQERRKFGPLGWNVPYEFGDADFKVGARVLKSFLDDYKEVPFEALRQMTGSIHYGGRVTDSWDLRVVSTLLDQLYTPAALEGTVWMGPFQVPSEMISIRQYREFAHHLPRADPPEVFGLDRNAVSLFHRQLEKELLADLLELSSGSSHAQHSGSDGGSIETAKLNMIGEKLPKPVQIDGGAKRGVLAPLENGAANVLGVFICNEIHHYNNLISVITSSLVDLHNGLKGKIVMTKGLEETLHQIRNDRVPTVWLKSAKPTTKSLGSWVSSLVPSVRYVEGWITKGQPPLANLSHFFNPRSLLTAVMQNCSRRTDLPLDSLEWDCQVTVVDPENKEDVDAALKDKKSILVSNLYLEGAAWEAPQQRTGSPIRRGSSKSLLTVARGTLVDAKIGELNYVMPPIKFTPKKKLNLPSAQKSNVYECPLYRNSSRADQQGQLPNYIMAVAIPTKVHPSKWILRGCALVTEPFQ